MTAAAYRAAGRGRRADETTAALRREIDGGRFQGADALPGERQLAQWFHVSRATLRQALAELIADGLLAHRQGMGTFIVRPRPDTVSKPVDGPVVDIGLNGPIHRSVEIERSLDRPVAEEALLLGLGPGGTVCRRTRVIFCDAGPLAVERTAVAPHVLPRMQWQGSTLSEALAEHGLRPKRKLQRLRAATLGAADAARLEAAPQAAAIDLQEAIFLDGGACCALTRALYRADRLDAVFSIDLE
ncbi:MAG TPA: GntR family transcriptional regulator [Lichenihabitans sp.]|jgi:GntR family transcriptional regulator|nr:GntR family transcriptional regulator [Lichenihabitans sp.]